MTVTITKPSTEPTPVVLARQALAELDQVRNDASFAQTPQIVARLEQSVQDLLALVEPAETVTEYGVMSWSRTFGRHHVDECRDWHEAQSVLRNTRRRLDASAQLMSRQVPVPAVPGPWVPVSPEDMVVALEESHAQGGGSRG
ncbi:hypothetical protein [Spirillospora sp. NBC_01491]|uniref:hypothetical protein n=1 Tax=Spirillospora sp. NBC_01491 TaxID=2976007 RepID=UPI002E309F00|nr:hypothetical protein [Spirillospora sp. NBC_01491]